MKPRLILSWGCRGMVWGLAASLSGFPGSFTPRAALPATSSVISQTSTTQALSLPGILVPGQSRNPRGSVRAQVEEVIASGRKTREQAPHYEDIATAKPPFAMIFHGVAAVVFYFGLKIKVLLPWLGNLIEDSASESIAPGHEWHSWQSVMISTLNDLRESIRRDIKANPGLRMIPIRDKFVEIKGTAERKEIVHLASVAYRNEHMAPGDPNRPSVWVGEEYRPLTPRDRESLQKFHAKVTEHADSAFKNALPVALPRHLLRGNPPLDDLIQTAIKAFYNEVQKDHRENSEFLRKSGLSAVEAFSWWKEIIEKEARQRKILEELPMPADISWQAGYVVENGVRKSTTKLSLPAGKGKVLQWWVSFSLGHFVHVKRLTGPAEFPRFDIELPAAVLEDAGRLAQTVLFVLLKTSWLARGFSFERADQEARENRRWTPEGGEPEPVPSPVFRSHIPWYPPVNQATRQPVVPRPLAAAS